MKKTLLNVMLSLGLAFSIQSTQASIIDFGGYLRDTSSGLEWLDVTATLGQSYNQVSALTDTSLAGWRYATGDEYNGLISNYTGQSISTYAASTLNVNPSTLISMLGQTEDFGQTSPASVDHRATVGLIGDSNLGSPYYASLVSSYTGPDLVTPSEYYFFESTAHTSTVSPDATSYAGNYYWSPASSPIGSFLVRPVPVPASLPMLFSGLIGLGMVRRKKMKA